MRKIYSPSITFRWLVTLCLAASIITSCTEDNSLTTAVESDFGNESRFMTTQISFELETNSIIEVAKEGASAHAELLDASISQPMAARQKIKVGLYPDGHADYIFEEATPEHTDFLDAFAEVPTNTIDPIHRTVITGGTANFYTKGGNLVYTHPFEDTEILNSDIDRILGKHNYLETAREEKAEIEELNNGTFVIRRPIELEIESSDYAKSNGKMYSEEVVVEDLNLLLGMSLHQSDGSLVTRTVFKYRYSEKGERWLPEMSFSEEHEANAVTGSKLVKKTTSYYDNLVITTK